MSNNYHSLIGESYNSYTIKGDAVMLDRYGNVLNSIDNKYHPNTGGSSNDYSEIERCINWLVDNNCIYKKSVKDAIRKVLWYRVVQEFSYLDSDDILTIDELVLNVMYSDNYTVNSKIVSYIKELYTEFRINKNSLKSAVNKLSDDSSYRDACSVVDSYINEYFLRVRSGGKLDFNNEDSIYFRISSHDFDWNNNITDFLWDTYKSISRMPSRIIVCYDAENRPPEKILFNGSPDEFLNYDYKKFENLRVLK